MANFELVPEISVIIPVYNGSETLSEQLDALTNQTYSGNWELIVVDNGSTDNTSELVKTYHKTISHLKLIIATRGKGASYARNEGARAARASKLLFCDADDIVDAGWVAAMAQALEVHPFVTGSLDIEKLNKDNYWVRYAPPNGSSKNVLEFLPYAISCNVGLAREVFEQVGGFSEAFIRGQDIDLSWRLHLNGYEVHDVPEAVVFYRFRRNLKDTWRQITAYAVSHVHLYQHYAPHGMPRSSFRKALKRYRWLIKRAYCLVLDRPQCRVKWLYTAALCWGRLKGSIRYRKFYL